jgi:hypothetical protein
MQRARRSPRGAAIATPLHDRSTPKRFALLALATAAAWLLASWLVSSAAAQTNPSQQPSADQASGNAVVMVAKT